MNINDKIIFKFSSYEICCRKCPRKFDFQIKKVVSMNDFEIDVLCHSEPCYIYDGEIINKVNYGRI